MSKPKHARPGARPIAGAAPAAASAADTRAQQLAARYVMWLGALLGILICVAGLWLLGASVHEGRIMPLRAGLGLVLAVLGGVLGCAGLYAAQHCRLIGGRLRFDEPSRALLLNPRFSKSLKWGAHGVGITVLAVSWLSVYFPNGIALK